MIKTLLHVYGNIRCNKTINTLWVPPRKNRIVIMDLREITFESLKKLGCSGVRLKPRQDLAEGQIVIHHTGAGPDSTRDAGPATAVEGTDRAMRSPARPQVRPRARRSLRASRNIAVALALAAFAVIMFLVTIVKFEEQIYKNYMSRARGEPDSTRVPASGADFDRGGDRVVLGDV